MKFKEFIHIVFFLTFLGCASMNFSYYWPYSKLPPNKVKRLSPVYYEDCIPAIDSVLSSVAKQHFKYQDSSIAVIEICEEIGGFFTTNWELYKYNRQYHWPNGLHTKLPKEPVDIASRFIYDGIYHPKAMIRIMFTCYYKQLHNQEYNWNDEIKVVKSIWPYENPTDFSELLPDTIVQLERRIISNYMFNLLTEGDTVNILYNRSPKFTIKSSDFYYLTGVINYKIPETETINIKITNIESEFKQDYFISYNDTLHIGDTLTNHHSGWLSRNHYYFNYHKCNEYREAFNLE